jgi:hypothetical protein
MAINRRCTYDMAFRRSLELVGNPEAKDTYKSIAAAKQPSNAVSIVQSYRYRANPLIKRPSKEN